MKCLKKCIIVRKKDNVILNLMTATGFKTVETGQQMAGKVRDTKKKQLEERSATN